MAHPLDSAIEEIRSAITAPGAPFALGEVEIGGARYPAFAGAPPDLPAFFTAFCGLYSDRCFLVDGDDRLTFGETLARARAFAAALAADHGVRPGDHIGLAARNGAAWVIAYMGILIAGGVATLVNAFWTGEEMAAAIADADCKLVLADERRHAALIALAGGAPAALALLPLDGDLDGALARFTGEEVEFPSLGPDAPATILFTSGSTARSKGAISDHRAKVQAAMNFACATAAFAEMLTRQGRLPSNLPATLVNLPLFHVTAEVAVMLTSFVIGRKLVLMPRWDALAAMRLIERERITYFIGVPLMGDEIVTHPRRGDFDLSSLTDIVAGGAARPPEHVPRINAGLPHAHPVMGYGLTETNAVGCNIVREVCEERPASTGRATLPLSDLAIFGEDGGMVPAGVEGEIGIRSVANIVGFWNRPEESRVAFTATGHVLTGDMGYLDAEGYLFIVGRKKDIVIRGGENISCAEVETALYALEDILECAVFGVPDKRLGEVPVAAVHLRPGADLDGAAIRAMLARHIAPYKLPDPVIVHAEPLPRLGTEKIDKRALRAAYLGG